MLTNARPIASARSMFVDTLLPTYAAKRSLKAGMVAIDAMKAPRLIVPAITGRRETADIAVS